MYDENELQDRIDETVAQYVKDTYPPERIKQIVESQTKEIEDEIKHVANAQTIETVRAKVNEIAVPVVNATVLKMVPDIIKMVEARAKEISKSAPGQIAGKIIANIMKENK